MFCDRCGHQLGERDQFCWQCGKRLLQNSLTHPSIGIDPEQVPAEPAAFFIAELDALMQAGLITAAEYDRVRQAHKTLQAKRAGSQSELPPSVVNVGVLQPVLIDLDQPLEPGAGTMPASAQPKQSAKPAKPAKEKKIRTAQDIRDRNITWVLVIGVLFVITAGVIFATSNWSIFSNTMKTALVVLITALFFGISLVTEKVLKIEKTAFAFWSLGALFVPVTILSAGFFQLFGPWLSLVGDGKYILGIVGATLTAAVLAISTFRYRNRLFAWLTLISCSLVAAFVIAAFRPSLDVFYLGIILYNALLVFLFAQRKHPASLQLFLREMHAFIPVNLVISTVCMLVFFKDPRLYGLNLILTSLIYVFMVFSKWEKEYSIVFSGTLIYGLYQIVENTPLLLVEPVIFALVGCLFAGVEALTRRRSALNKIFIYTSGFISLLTFLYINVKSLLILKDQPSWSILLSFLILALNYFYLAYRSPMPAFAWLAPLFLVAAGEQLYELIRLSAGNYLHAAHTFAVAAALFVGLYFFNTWQYTRKARASSGILALATMGYAFLISQFEHNPWTAVVILTGLVNSLILVRLREASRKLRTLLDWATPVVIALALFMFFTALLPPARGALFASGSVGTNLFWYDRFSHFYLAAISLFAISLALRRPDRELAQGAFRVSHILIPLATLLAGTHYYDHPVLFALLLLIYLVSIKITRIDQGKRASLRRFLYDLYTVGTVLIFSLLAAFNADDQLYFYVLPACSVFIALIWWRMQANWKRWTTWYFIPFSLLSGLILSIKPDFTSVDYALLLIMVSLILSVLHQTAFKNLAPLALLLLYPGTAQFSEQVLKDDRIALLITWAILAAILRLAGQVIYRKLFDFKNWHDHFWAIDIDWYSLASLFCVAAIEADIVVMAHPGWFELIPPLLLSTFLWSQRQRVNAGVARQIVDTLWLASVMLPYETLIDLLNLPKIIETEARLLPLLPLAILLTHKTWSMSHKLRESLELLVLLVIAGVLFKDILIYDYFTDALIMGVLSLVCLAVGLHVQRKTYFSVGAGSLVLNGIIQTRSFWQSLPWWAYLLLAGLILIGLASYTELRKRK